MSTVTYFSNTSAVGDTVCVVPAVRALINDKKLYKVLANKRNCEVFRLCGIGEEFIVEISSTEELKSFDPKGSTMVCANIPGHAAYRIHLVDLFTIFPLNAVLKPHEKCIAAVPELLPPIEQKEWGPYEWGDYVVIGVGYAQMSRRLPVKAYNEIVSFLKKRGLNIVLLGGQRDPGSKHPINFEEHPREGCIDLIGKTTIPESIAIMNFAKCVIGVDSGLIYLASVTDVPIVCGFSFVESYYRAPYRHGEKGWNFYPVETTSPCRYCSSDLAMFGVAFDTQCPKGRGYLCAESLRGADFIAEIKKALSKKSLKKNDID